MLYCCYLCCSVVIFAVLLLLCCTVVICVVMLLFVLFYVLFVCKCVLYHCHRVFTQLQLTNISLSIPLLPLWAVRPVQSLSACTRVTFTFYIYNFWELTGLISYFYTTVSGGLSRERQVERESTYLLLRQDMVLIQNNME